MKSPLLDKFLCCIKLRTGCLLIGTLDTLLYGSIILVFSLHLFFDVEVVDRKYGEECFHRESARVAQGFVLITESGYNGIFQHVFLYVSVFISICFLVGIKQVDITFSFVDQCRVKNMFSFS